MSFPLVVEFRLRPNDTQPQADFQSVNKNVEALELSGLTLGALLVEGRFDVGLAVGR